MAPFRFSRSNPPVKLCCLSGSPAYQSRSVGETLSDSGLFTGIPDCTFLEAFARMSIIVASQIAGVDSICNIRRRFRQTLYASLSGLYPYGD